MSRPTRFWMHPGITKAYTAPELVAMGRIGESRAEQGIPLEAMLRVYRITTDEIFSVLMGEDVEQRRSFIQRNAKDVRFLDI